MLRDAGRAERLRRVLEHGDAELDERPHVHRARPKRCTGMIACVRSVTFAAASSTSRLSVDGVDVGEDRSRAAPHDRLGRRVEREGRADHLVAGADAERVEREDERIGAVRDADRPLHAEVGGGLLLERPVVRRRG